MQALPTLFALAWPWSNPTAPAPPPSPSTSSSSYIVERVPALQGWDVPSIIAACILLTIVMLLMAAVETTTDVSFTGPALAGRTIYHACEGGVRSRASVWQRFSGALAATIFTVVYIAVPILLVVIPFMVVMYPSWWLTWAFAGPFLLSAIVPPIPSRSFLQVSSALIEHLPHLSSNP